MWSGEQTGIRQIEVKVCSGVSKWGCGIVTIMDKYHVVEDVCIEDGVLRLVVDAVQVERPLLALSPLLAQASSEQQNVFEVSPSGYGIPLGCWMRIWR